MTAIAQNYFFDFFQRLYDYREYLIQSVMRDLRTKYKRSALGYVWTMLHPLGMMSVLAVVFSHVMRVPIPDYAIFVFCGLLPWNYFQSTTLMSLNTIRVNARLFCQVPVPKYLFVLSIVFSNMVNLVLALVPLLLLMLIFGHGISLSVFAFPLVFLPLFLVTTGIALLLAASNVFYDDTLHISQVVLQAMYFMVPVMYGREMLPPRISGFLSFNPLFQQIEFFRGLFYYGTFPDLNLYVFNLGVSVLLLAVCLLIFVRSEEKFLYFV